MDGPASRADGPGTGGRGRPPAGAGRSSTADGGGGAVARFCYPGESVLHAVRFSGGLVGVTTHRVLALTPGESGPNLQAVDRPNVTGIELSSGGDVGRAFRAVRYVVYGLALIGGSYLVDFSSVSAVDPPAGTGVGPVVNLALALVGLLQLVDDGLRYAGVGVLGLALLFVALYVYSRESYLAIGVAGGDPVRVPASASESAAAARLRAAVEKA